MSAVATLIRRLVKVAIVVGIIWAAREALIRWNDSRAQQVESASVKPMAARASHSRTGPSSSSPTPQEPQHI